MYYSIIKCQMKSSINYTKFILQPGQPITQVGPLYQYVFRCGYDGPMLREVTSFVRLNVLALDFAKQ